MTIRSMSEQIWLELEVGPAVNGIGRFARAINALSRGNRPSHLEAGATVLPNEQRSAA